MGLFKIAFMVECCGENKTDGMEYLWLIDCENSITSNFKKSNLVAVKKKHKCYVNTCASNKS